MDFIKKMKKREFIEMGLKTLAAVLAAFLAIILMEGMIYSIKLNALKNGKTHTTNSTSTIAYCIKEGKDQYFVVYYNEDAPSEWQATEGQYKTKQECKEMEGSSVKKVYMRAPNAFELSITGVHYIVMSVFMAGVAGFFVYRFIKLSKTYKKIEEEFIKTGTVELENV